MRSFSSPLSLTPKARSSPSIAATAFEAQEGIVILDADKRILRVNRAFAEMTGHAAEDVIGKTPQQIRSAALMNNSFTDSDVVEFTLEPQIEVTESVISDTMIQRVFGHL